MNTDLIALGELLIDFLPGKEPGSYVRNAGGAPANVAIAAAKNGLKAAVYSKVGDDDFGHFLVDTLNEWNVEPLCKEMTKEATTTMAFVTLNEENDRSFTFARKPGADMLLSADDIDSEDIKNTKLVHGGSFSLSSPASKEATIKMLKEGHDNGKLVSFDINYRNVVWDDDKQKCADEVKKLLDYIDLLKVSDEEIDMLDGEENIPLIMKEKNISVIIETLGKNGSKYFCRDANGEIVSEALSGYSPSPDKVADTTGAGDAFWGAFLSKLLIEGVEKTSDLNQDIVRTAVDYGNASGALTVQKKGAIPAIPTRKEIEIFLKEK